MPSTLKKRLWAYIVYLNKFKELSKAIQLSSIAEIRKNKKVLAARGHSLFLASELFGELRMFDDEDSSCHIYTVIVISSERNCCGKLNGDVYYGARDYINDCIDNNHIVNIVSIG